MAIEAFKIMFQMWALLHTQEKLAQTRWTDAVAGSGWTYGVDIDYMMAIRDYWMNRFDWRRHEADLEPAPSVPVSDGWDENSLPPCARTRPAPLPIILTHGWPGSFWKC